MLQSTAERHAKCHVRMVYSTNFLFVKQTTGVVSKSFFAERVHFCTCDSVCLSQDHSPVFMLLIPNKAVKPRCLGRVISVCLYTMRLQAHISSLSGGGYGSPPRWLSFCTVKQLDLPSDKIHFVTLHGAVYVINK